MSHQVSMYVCSQCPDNCIRRKRRHKVCTVDSVDCIFLKFSEMKCLCEEQLMETISGFTEVRLCRVGLEQESLQ